jgi:hypothetical protein
MAFLISPSASKAIHAPVVPLRSGLIEKNRLAAPQETISS